MNAGGVRILRLFCFVFCVGTAALAVLWATILAAVIGLVFLVGGASGSSGSCDSLCFRSTSDRLAGIGIGVVLLAVGSLLGWLSFVLWRAIVRRIQTRVSRISAFPELGLTSALVFIAVALTFVFLRLNRGSDRTEEFPAGRIQDFASLSPRYFEDERFWLVRLPSADFLALDEYGGQSGCPVAWHSDFDFMRYTGWFVDSCNGNVYDPTGRCFSGPEVSCKNLARYPVVVSGDAVSVNLQAQTRDPPRYPGPCPYPEAVAPSSGAVNQKQIGDLLLTLFRVEPYSDERLPSETGTHYVAANIAAENTGCKSYSLNAANFRLNDSAGHSNEPAATSGPNPKIGALGLMPGQEVRGFVAFKVADGRNPVDLGYQSPSGLTGSIWAEASGPTGDVEGPNPEWAQRLIDLFNERMASKGLSPLSRQQNLMTAAQKYAEYSYKNGDVYRLDHYLDGTPTQRAQREGYQHPVTEEIGASAPNDYSPDEIMQRWLSAPNFDTILSGAREIGAGCYQSPFPGTSTSVQMVVCVEVFGFPPP